MTSISGSSSAKNSYTLVQWNKKEKKKIITAEESCRVHNSHKKKKHAGPNKAYNNSSSQKYQQIKNYIFISILKPH